MAESLWNYWFGPKQEESATKEETLTTRAKESKLENILKNMKLDHLYKDKLSMSTLLQIDVKALEHLPRLCAQLLLDGFPLELVDGDASNIPLRWVSDVLTQLHDLVSPNNKILVITVLGVQSTGKSTLLNTMFGVQFAVSMIIDTEGLKSPELAQLDSHEHDNELATLVVGLSDITIVNIKMENATEMKDICR
ncbi:hypothetical protein WMY93_014062 [Mugilogobius chulae]|uniref:VLIG-type G domain-containing protein n=1 Tax=Mugilogobius chulae TaxID=88201 RepID=A0AAW0P4B9_9GOBI